MKALSETLTLCLARRIAQQDKQPQQAVIVQTAARLLQQTSDQLTKASLLDLIAASPSERQRILNVAEKLVLTGE